MRQLEERVAHPLFHRTGRGVKLTDAGVLLSEFAVQYLRNLKVLQTSMDQLAGAIPSRVSIVIPRLVGRFLIPPLVKLADNRWPDTTFTIHEKLGASIPMAVQLGEFNFGIAYVDSKGSQSLREQIAIEYLRLVGTGAMIGTTDATITLKEVAQLPLALPTKQSPYRKLIEMVFREAGLEPNVVRELETPEALLAFAEDGGVATILPHFSVYRELVHGKAVSRRITEPDIERPISLLISPGLDNHFVKEMVSFIKEVVDANKDQAKWR